MASLSSIGSEEARRETCLAFGNYWLQFADMEHHMVSVAVQRAEMYFSEASRLVSMPTVADLANMNTAMDDRQGLGSRHPLCSPSAPTSNGIIIHDPNGKELKFSAEAVAAMNALMGVPAAVASVSEPPRQTATNEQLPSPAAGALQETSDANQTSHPAASASIPSQPANTEPTAALAISQEFLSQESQFSDPENDSPSTKSTLAALNTSSPDPFISNNDNSHPCLPYRLKTPPSAEEFHDFKRFGGVTVTATLRSEPSSPSLESSALANLTDDLTEPRRLSSNGSTASNNKQPTSSAPKIPEKAKNRPFSISNPTQTQSTSFTQAIEAHSTAAQNVKHDLEELQERAGDIVDGHGGAVDQDILRRLEFKRRGMFVDKVAER